MKLPRGSEKSCGPGGPFSSRWGGAGQGRGRTPAQRSLQLVTLLPSGLLPPVSETPPLDKSLNTSILLRVARVKDDLCEVVREGTGESIVSGQL